MTRQPPFVQLENLDLASVPEAFILPAQWQDLVRAEVHRTGELRLVAAIFHEALYTLQSYHGNPHIRARRLYQEALDWINDTDTRHPFSFENCCTYLGLETSWIRRGLKQWLVRQQPGQIKYDIAHAKICTFEKNATSYGPGRPRNVIWSQKMRNLQQWRVFFRRGELTYELANCDTAEEAHRIEKWARKHPRLALARSAAGQFN